MPEPSLVVRMREIVHSHPVLSLAVPTVAFAWVAFLFFIALRLDPSLAVLLLSLFLVAIQVVASWIIGGWPEVRRVFRRLLYWRFNALLWIIVLAGAPVVTLAVAAATGTLQTPANGWGSMVSNYLISTLLIGALLVNLWEESLWGGMVQNRPMARHGLLIGSLLSAIPFALIHLPLAFGPPAFFGTSVDRVLVIWAVMIGTAPFFRYLMGMMLIETRGSTLAIGLLHASWNASSSLPAVNGGWQYIAALGVLVLVLAAWRAARGQSLVSGQVPQRDATTA